MIKDCTLYSQRPRSQKKKERLHYAPHRKSKVLSLATEHDLTVPQVARERACKATCKVNVQEGESWDPNPIAWPWHAWAAPPAILLLWPGKVRDTLQLIWLIQPQGEALIGLQAFAPAALHFVRQSRRSYQLGGLLRSHNS